MSYNPDAHHRRSIRLSGYDYSSGGAYMVTLCTHGREMLFGAVENGVMVLNQCGIIVRDEWLHTTEIRPEVELDAYVVMPNHFHGIMIIHESYRAHGRAPLPISTTLQRSPRSLGALIAGFKSAVTKRINTERDSPGTSVWQRNYYEQVIRSETMLNALRQYIDSNPANWSNDVENR